MSIGRQFERPPKISGEQAASVRSALEFVISSDAFAGSKQCQDFLRLLVERALWGELDTLSERTIGVEMFGRPADYDTSKDAIVRLRAPEFHWPPRTSDEDAPVPPAPSVPVAPAWRHKSLLVFLAVLAVVSVGLLA